MDTSLARADLAFLLPPRPTPSPRLGLMFRIEGLGHLGIIPANSQSCSDDSAFLAAIGHSVNPKPYIDLIPETLTKTSREEPKTRSKIEGSGLRQQAHGITRCNFSLSGCVSIEAVITKSGALPEGGVQGLGFSWVLGLGSLDPKP